MPLPLAAIGLALGGVRAVAASRASSGTPGRFFTDALGNRWAFDKYGKPFRYRGKDTLFNRIKNPKAARREEAQYSQLLNIYTDLQRRVNDPAAVVSRYNLTQRQISDLSARLQNQSSVTAQDNSTDALPLLLLAGGAILLFMVIK